MEALLYLAKVNLFLVIFYGCYWLLFRQHTFFVWNRIYLITSLAAALTLPSVTFTETYQVAIPTALPDVAAATEVTQQQVHNQSVDLEFIIMCIYAIGVIAMLGRLLYAFYKLYKTIKNGECLVLDNYTLVLIGKKQPSVQNSGSFSFFKWLVVSKADYEDHPDVILRHEEVHIRQLHSLDILVVEVLKVLFWFNPAIWFYKRSLQEIHEFLADQEIPDRDTYANFLVSYALHVPQRLITNHFFNSSLLKSRIKMIYKNRTPNWLLGKYALILPVTFVLIFLTAARERIAVQMPALGNVVLPQRPVFQDAIVDVKGIVVNVNGEPIADAMVILKGTTRGTATGKKGEFELKEVQANGKLVISHIQYSSVVLYLEKNKTFYKVSLPKSVEVVNPSNITKATSPEKFINYKSGQLPESVTKPLTVIEQKPQFPGGYEALMSYLNTTLKYPATALKANVGGITIVRFKVDTDGNIGDVVILKGVGFGIDMESIRLVKNMPKWEPGIQNGKPIAMDQTIEIKFDLDEARQKSRQGLLDEKKPAILPTMTELGMYFNKFIDFSGNNPNQKQVVGIDTTKKAAYSSNYRYMNYRTVLPAYSYRFQKK